ncbi:uncharacterized protein LOC128882693 [Hylaeus volcanicus]|uniref:uncharacterized protein LOC128882693 n=1 Tax=Hylaeus volcanicus TaxID=313075 RepID=UPI0023B85F20|nr:uncharacterized protein LOC128882693 [Hylaeus volcanicus]
MFLNGNTQVTPNLNRVEEDENDSNETQALMSDVTQWYNKTRSKSEKKLSFNADEKPYQESFPPLSFIQNTLHGIRHSVVDSVTEVKDNALGIKESIQFHMLSSFLIFLGFLMIFCSFLFLPMIVFSPHKFAILFTSGSLFVINGIGLMKGYDKLFYHLIQPSRCPLSIAYIMSVITTLFATLKLHSYFLTLGSSIIQMICLASFLTSYVLGNRLYSFTNLNLFNSLKLVQKKNSIFSNV